MSYNEFDKSLDELMDTRGLIIDLRNIVDGGNSYVAVESWDDLLINKSLIKHIMIEKSMGAQMLKGVGLST